MVAYSGDFAESEFVGRVASHNTRGFANWLVLQHVIHSKLAFANWLRLCEIYSNSLRQRLSEPPPHEIHW